MAKRDNLTDIVAKAGTSQGSSGSSSGNGGKVTTSNGTQVTLTTPKPATRKGK